MHHVFICMLRRLLLAAVLTGLGAAALAQSNASVPAASPSPAAAGMQPGQWRQMAAARHAEYMAGLKAALAITPEQESAWNQFESAVWPLGPPRQPIGPEQRSQRLAERAKHLSQVNQAAAAFHDQLTPDQQKVFAEQWASRPGMRRGMQGQGGMRGACAGCANGPGMAARQPAAAASQSN